MCRYILVGAGLVIAAAACGKPSPAAEPKAVEAAPLSPTKVDPTPAAPPSSPTVHATPRGPEHAVYSLVDNRLSAHLVRDGGLLVPAGSAGFAKYTRIGNIIKGYKRPWELRQTEGDVKVARIVGKSGSMFVPLTAAQASRNSLRLRVFAADHGTLSVRVNEHKDINGKYDSGWSTVELSVPAGELVEGENQLALFAKQSGLEVAWLEAGADSSVRGPESSVPGARATVFYDPDTKALQLPKAGGMSWFVAIPDKTKLTADLADPTCEVGVLATSEDGTTAEGKLTGAGSAVDLSALAGKAARLDLMANGCANAAVTNAALVVPGDEPAVKHGEPPKFVVFIVMDALRADKIRAINPKARPETPNWDKLAESSTLFVNAYQQGNESQVSHASIWSSTYLAKHKAIEMHDKLADKWVTIDEVAKKAGKFVAGASGNGYIRPSRGFGSGWDQFVNHIEKGLGLRGADIVDKGLSFVQPKKDRPWFLYLGLIDTHVTWRAKEPWMSKYDGGYKGRFATEYGDDGPHGSDGKDLTDREKDHVRALYDSNVSYQDDLLGQLVEKLKSWGIYDQTMIIVTADHGDELWEDGRVGHGGSERETLLHVPLLIHYPPQFPAGRVTEGVEGIDIVPTLADALGVANDPEWQGMSLVPVAEGAAGGYPWMSFSSQYENGHGGRIGHWKMKLFGPGTPRLFDLAKDPDERKDLFGTRDAEIGARLMLDPMWMLRQWNAEWKKSQWGNAADVSNRFASDLGE
ncbi:MAG TPA: sulfatase [Kofleriaceae bacterium]|jgi:arylsulfatase A-like enzyme